MPKFRHVLAAVLLLAPLLAEGASLNKELVISVIRGRQAGYEQCYTAALGWNPELKGRLLIRFSVDTEGQVSAASEQTGSGEKFPDEVMTGCVVEQFRQLSFPSSGEEYQVTYPLIFQQKKSR